MIGNSGLGKESIRQLYQHNPAQIYLAARTSAKFDSALADIQSGLPDPKTTPNITFLELDLSSLASVRAAAEKVLGEAQRLDTLMNNAGVMGEPSLTTEGYELQFGTNHIGHMLLTLLLLPLLLKTSSEGENDVRIVNLSSGAHKFPPSEGILLANDGEKLKTDMRSYSLFTRYGQSKLANILFAAQFAKRYPHLISVSIHPGAVSTNLGGTMTKSMWILNLIRMAVEPLLKTTKDGVKNQLWAATAKKEVLENGRYYEPIGNKNRAGALVGNEKLEEGLWEWTEKELINGGWWNKD